MSSLKTSTAKRKCSSRFGDPEKDASDRRSERCGGITTSSASPPSLSLAEHSRQTAAVHRLGEDEKTVVEIDTRVLAIETQVAYLVTLVGVQAGIEDAPGQFGGGRLGGGSEDRGRAARTERLVGSPNQSTSDRGVGFAGRRRRTCERAASEKTWAE